MTHELVYRFDDDVEEAATMMEENRLRRLAVTDRNKHLVGIVSRGDLPNHWRQGIARIPAVIREAIVQPIRQLCVRRLEIARDAEPESLKTTRFSALYRVFLLSSILIKNLHYSSKNYRTLCNVP